MYVCGCVYIYIVFYCLLLPHGFEDKYYILEHPVANTTNSAAALFCLFRMMPVNYVWFTSMLRHCPLRSKDCFTCILGKYFVVETEEPKTDLCFL
jgi:hypothetical protein